MGSVKSAGRVTVTTLSVAQRQQFSALKFCQYSQNHDSPQKSYPAILIRSITSIFSKIMSLFRVSYPVLNVLISDK